MKRTVMAILALVSFLLACNPGTGQPTLTTPSAPTKPVAAPTMSTQELQQLAPTVAPKVPAMATRVPAAAPTANPAATGSDIVYITKSGQKYHRAGCRYLAKSAIPIERADAIARGYTPCNVCKP